MKKHLIPILIIVLLLLAGLLLVIGALMRMEHMNGTALVLAAQVPCLYGPAAALLIPLHRKDRAVPRGYAWLAVAAFMTAVIGLAVIHVGYYVFYMPEIEPWVLLSGVVCGLLLPFFVSSVVHLKEPVPPRTPEERRRTRKRAMTALLVCLGAILLTGGGLYLRKMSQPHTLSVQRKEAMYGRFQELIANDEPWETVDRATHISATEDGSDREERDLTVEERAAMAHLCRELIRSRADREEWYTGTIVPRKRMQYLWVDYQAAADVIVEGETYQVHHCVLKEYSDIREVQIEYTQGEMRHAVILYWDSETEE